MTHQKFLVLAMKNGSGVRSYRKIKTGSSTAFSTTLYVG